MAKYSKAAQKSVASAMKKTKKGTLRSGGSGKKVTNKKQSIAIGLSQPKQKGAKVVSKKTTEALKDAAKKTTLKPDRSVRGKIAVSKKVISKKSSNKKQLASKPAPKKTASSKVAAKKTTPKKTVPKKIVKKPVTSKPKVNTSAIKRATRKKGDNINLPAATQMNPKKEIEAPEQNNNATIFHEVEDPIKSTDQNVYNKATSKIDPKHNMAVSSTRKGGVKPSGKKPLW